MKIFRFMFYSLACIIGLNLGFCSHINHDYNDYKMDAALGVKKESEGSKNQVSGSPVFRKGKKLFKMNCATCHNRNMIDDLTGPALKGVEDRWEGREDLLYAWIRNAAAVVESGDKYAIELYNKYEKSPMTAFPNLKDEEIDALLTYIEEAAQ